MTTEGRPEYVGVDWDKQYNRQRRDRLDDAISEYLSDDTKTDPRQCYEEILSIAQEWIDYHQNNINRWNQLKSLMLGHRDPLSALGQFTGEDTLTTGNINLDIS